MDSPLSNKFQVNCEALRSLMPIKLSWKINDSYEFKSSKDNKWHAAIVTNLNSEIHSFTIVILSTKEEWKVVIKSQNIYIRPFYNDKIH